MQFFTPALLLSLASLALAAPPSAPSGAAPPSLHDALMAVQAPKEPQAHKARSLTNPGTITITHLKIVLYQNTGGSALSLDVSDSNSKVAGSCSGTAKIADGIQYCSPVSWSYAIAEDLSSLIVNHTVHHADGSTLDRVAVWYFEDDDVFHMTCSTSGDVCTGISTDSVTVDVEEYVPRDASYGDLAY